MKKIFKSISFLGLCCGAAYLFAATNDNASNQDLLQIQRLQSQAIGGAAPSISPPNGPATAASTTPVAANSANLESERAANLAKVRAVEQEQRNDQLRRQGIDPGAATTKDNEVSQLLQGGNELSSTQRQQAQAAADVLNQTPPLVEKAISDAAFQQALQALIPLTPEQIVELRKKYNQNELARATAPGNPPKPVATSQIVNLAPGSTPPSIRLAEGFVSSLVFIDSSGAEWPIAAYDLGNPQAFNVQWDRKSNTLMIQATEQYTFGNLAVRLQGLSTPVMLTLIPGQKAVDYRVDLRVQGYGPNARAIPIGDGLPGSADSLLMSVLDGVPPPNSRELTVPGGQVQAWVQKEKMYVRTRFTLISPGWLATMQSADGMHVYQMQRTPLLLVSENGKVTQIRIEGL